MNEPFELAKELRELSKREEARTDATHYSTREHSVLLAAADIVESEGYLELARDQLLKDVIKLAEERDTLQAKVKELEVFYANTYDRTCIHHTDEERSTARCPVCRKKENDTLAAENARLKPMSLAFSKLKQIAEGDLLILTADNIIAHAKGVVEIIEETLASTSREENDQAQRRPDEKL